MNGEKQVKMRVQTTIRLPDELMAQLKRRAEERGYTLNDLVLFYLWGHVHESNLPA